MPPLRSSISQALLLVLAGAVLGCSANKAGDGDGGKLDASVDGGDDATDETGGGGPDDAPIYPEAQSLRAPDGCYYSGAACMDPSICCSGNCVEGGCELPIRQQ